MSRAPPLLLALLGVVALAGCTDDVPTADAHAGAVAVPGDGPQPFSLLDWKDGDAVIGGASFSLTVPADAPANLSAAIASLKTETDAYRDTVLADPAPAGGDLSAYAQNLAILHGATARMEVILTKLDAFKHDDHLYPTWSEIDAAKATLRANHDALVGSQSEKARAAYADRTDAIDDGRAAALGKVLLYGAPALLVGLGFAYLMVRYWEKQTVYWQTFSARNRFMDPRILLLLAGGLVFATAWAGLLFTSYGQRLILYLMPGV